MARYILKRVLISLVTIFAVITVTFFLIRLMPGGPFDGDKMTPEVKANLNEKYGLDKPLLEQYGIYMGNLAKGDMGESMIFPGRSVNENIEYSFPTSAKLGVVSILFSVLTGVFFGIVAALKAGKWQDKVCMFLATIGMTVPSFVIGSVLIYFLTVELRLLPAVGFYGPENYIMPVLALSGSAMAFITRLTRTRLADVLKSDYIRTAKAKGLSRGTIIIKHALRNSLIPIVTYLGPLIAGVLTGSFVVEIGRASCRERV